MILNNKHIVARSSFYFYIKNFTYAEFDLIILSKSKHFQISFSFFVYGKEKRVVYLARPAEIDDSKPQSLVPRMILNNPIKCKKAMKFSLRKMEKL